MILGSLVLTHYKRVTEIRARRLYLRRALAYSSAPQNERKHPDFVFGYSPRPIKGWYRNQI